jgi:hypothetical protein
MMEQYRLGHTEDEVFQTVLHRTESQFSDEFQAWCQLQVAGWGYDEATGKKYDELRQEGEDLIGQKQYQLARADLGAHCQAATDGYSAAQAIGGALQIVR